MTTQIYRHNPFAPLPEATAPEPVPTVERIPKTIDRSTWAAYANAPDGGEIYATGRTKKECLEQFSMKWRMFA